MNNDWQKLSYILPRIILIAVIDTYLVVKLGEIVKPMQIPVFFKVIMGMSFGVGFIILCVLLMYFFHKKANKK